MVIGGGICSTNKLEVVITVALVILVAAILSFITAQSSIYSPPRERALSMRHKVPTLDSSSSSNNSRQASHTVDKKH
jgi:hypothetical protein